MADWLAIAKAHLDNGRPDIAEALCARLVQSRPDDADALAAWGKALLQREGPAPRAVQALRTATALAPEAADYWVALVEAELRIGDLSRAAKALSETLRISSANPRPDGLARVVGMIRQETPPPADDLAALGADDLLLLARALIVMNEASRAKAPILALQSRPDVPADTWLPSWARALAGTGELEGAVDAAAEAWSRAASMGPFVRRMIGSEAEAICRALEGPLASYEPRRVLLARVLLDTPDRFFDGIKALNEVLAKGSVDADALAAGGRAYLRQGAFDDALALLEQARARYPDHAEIMRLYAAAGWADEAKSEPLPPIDAANDLAILAEGLCAAGDLERAAEVLDAAVAAQPGREDLLIVLADVLAVAGRFEAARARVDAALDIHPGEPKARMLRASLALQAGDMDTGWRDFENRFHYWRRDTPPRSFSAPRWHGEPGGGRTLMVWREEGIGDEMRFAARIPDLAALGFRRIIFECAPRLKDLFARSFPGIEVRAEPDSAVDEDFDLQVPLFSLPGILGKQERGGDDRSGYLRADPARAGAVEAALSELGPPPWIGMCWRSLNASWMKRPFHSRIEDWGPVLALPEGTFINLQVEAEPGELAAAEKLAGRPVHTVAGLDLRHDIEGVAAVIARLDTVVSARCWIPILAGALGVQTHCFAAPFNPYFFGNARDPWMPAVRIYVEEPGAGWQGAMQSIGEALRDGIGTLPSAHR